MRIDRPIRTAGGAAIIVPKHMGWINGASEHHGSHRVRQCSVIFGTVWMIENSVSSVIRCAIGDELSIGGSGGGGGSVCVRAREREKE